MAVDRKSTRLNSSHMSISYAVFCLKKKKNESRWTSACASNWVTALCHISGADAQLRAVHAERALRVFFFFNDTATTEIYTLSHTTLFRSRPRDRSSELIDSLGHCALRDDRDVVVA